MNEYKTTLDKTTIRGHFIGNYLGKDNVYIIWTYGVSMKNHKTNLTYHTKNISYVYIDYDKLITYSDNGWLEIKNQNMLKIYKYWFREYLRTQKLERIIF